MKRKNNLYNKMLSYDNAYKVFNRIKNNTKNKNKVFKFMLNLNTNIYSILFDLYDYKYKFDKYNIFLIKKPKYRIIMSENIRDKVVNHLISEYILLPALDKCSIDTNVATRKNKGGDYAFKSFLKYANILKKENKEIYVLKMDIKKYFYSIDHHILFDMLKEKIKDNNSLNIIKKLLETTNELYINDSINRLKYLEIKRILKINISFKEKENIIKEINKIPVYDLNKGLPIGNMTSQILATFYLWKVDRFIKENLKCKYYIRYMDDLVILCTDKNKLLSIIPVIEKEILKYNLSINNKTNIYKLNFGVSFVGYFFKLKKNKILVKIINKNYKRIKKKLAHLSGNEYTKSFSSYNGLFIRCSKKVYEFFKGNIILKNDS